MRGDYDLERLVYLANLEISASSTTLHSTGSCPESLRWIRKTHGLFRFANHKIENDTETQTYPVWWRRSQSTKRISTSKGVICDIICAECRNSSGKKKSKFNLKQKCFERKRSQMSTFSYFQGSGTIGSIQVDLFNQFDIGQKWYEGDEKGIWDLLVLTSWHQVGFDWFSEKMALDIDHNIKEIFGWNESRSVIVFGFESNLRIFIVEIMQKLWEFRVSNHASLVFAEIQLDKVRTL